MFKAIIFITVVSVLFLSMTGNAAQVDVKTATEVAEQGILIDFGERQVMANNGSTRSGWSTSARGGYKAQEKGG